VESRFVCVFLQASGFLPALERSTSPLSLRALPVWNCRPTCRCYESARDCPWLARRGQEKNRRRHSPAFTLHAQFFHKHCARATSLLGADFCGICEYIFTLRTNLAQNTRKLAW